MLGRTAYMSMYSSMWSNRVRSGGYSGRLLITYSSPSLHFTPLDSLIFLLGFHRTLLDVVFGALDQNLQTEGSGRWIDHFLLPGSV